MIFSKTMEFPIHFIASEPYVGGFFVVSKTPRILQPTATATASTERLQRSPKLLHVSPRRRRQVSGQMLLQHRATLGVFMLAPLIIMHAFGKRAMRL